MKTTGNMTMGGNSEEEKKKRIRRKRGRNKWNGYDYYDNEYIKENYKLNYNDNNYPTIDHKISIYYGFSNNIEPYIISNTDNLCITKKEINRKKSIRNENEFKKDIENF